VARLLRLRRPALGEVELSGHIFPVTYKAVDRELPAVLAAKKPQALLGFGLASRTPYVRVETRARNAVTTLWPDADHTRVRKGSIAGGADAVTFGRTPQDCCAQRSAPASMPAPRAMPAATSATI
jgi:pyroglutamyl-peptidase